MWKPIIILTIFAVFILFIIILAYLFSKLVTDLVSDTRKMPAHNPSHPGITADTVFGQKDIICPKCQSPYCQYHYDKIKYKDRYKSKTRVHLLNPFKPLVEEKITVIPGEEVTIQEYRCSSCGYIFR